MDRDTQGYIVVHYQEITVADVIDDYIEDTDGNVWCIWFDDPFDKHDLTVGTTLTVSWRGFNDEPEFKEVATFENWVNHPPPATE